MSILDSLTSTSIGNAIVGAVSSITGYNLTASVPQDNRDPNRSRPRVSGSDPTTKIDQSSNTNILSYPADRPKYYMSFGFQEYARPSMFEGLSSQGITDYICLPMPARMEDQSQFSYKAEDGNGVIDGVLPELRGFRDSWATGGVDSLANFTSQAGDVAGAIGSATVGAGIRQVAASVFGGQYSQDAKQIMGIADNPFQTIAFKGANFKQHNFSWRFAPRNQAETQVVQKIIATFKKVAHPELLTSMLGGFYKYPDIVWPKFNPDAARQNLYTFKPCVITELYVNWAPDGRVAFFNDSSPAIVDFGISLMEIELWRGGEGDGTLLSGTINTGDFNSITVPTTRDLGQV